MTPAFDIVIVGAGAAGLMTAIAAGRRSPPAGEAGAEALMADRCGGRNLRILLLDSRKKPGAKILISGGTRCNVTNVRVSPSDFEGGPSHFVKHVLEAFTPEESRKFFDDIGVKLILEPSGKYFPTTHSGQTVLNALLRETENAGVEQRAGAKITRIEKEKELFVLSSETEKILARRVVLATGGLSLPETGSDGTGLHIAQSLGHSLVPTCPALTPLTTDDKDWHALSGVSLEASLSFFEHGKKKAERSGSFLFTHFGFSGPSALDISRFVARSEGQDTSRVEADFLPGQTRETFAARFEAFRKKHPRKLLKSFFSEEAGLPESFVETLLGKNGFDPKRPVEQVPAKTMSVILHRFSHCSLPVTGVVGYRKAEVTAGGVDLREVNVSTLESKIVPGLYFAGEILDVDGRIGGFNFQWSWSSGTVAGRSAVRSFS